jgi:acylaminoacyl-peptidase
MLRAAALPRLLCLRPPPRCAPTKARAAPTMASAAASAQPREQPAALEAEMQAFVELGAAPSYTRGALTGGAGDLSLMLTASQRDFEANAPRAFLQSVRVDERLHAPSFGFELRGAALAVPSPSGRRMLVVRNPTPASSALLLELWGGGRLMREIEVPSSLHGAVYADGWFESVAWSSGEDRVAYVAEAPPAVRTPLWGGRAPAGTPRGSDAPGSGWRGQSEHVDDAGEQLTGKRVAALYVVDVPSGHVHAVRGLPAHSSCGQAVWSPDDAQLVFTAWPHASARFKTQRRLGVIYCFNRESAVWAVPAPLRGGDTAADASAMAEPVCLTPALQSAFSPRFSPDGAVLAVASADAACATGAHNASFALHTLPWAAGGGVAGEPRCVLPVVTAPARAGDWPGWFSAGAMARAPWVSDTQLIIVSTWGSGDALVCVDVSSGAVQRITPPLAEEGHWQLLDVRGGVCAAVVSTPTSPPCVAVATAPDWAWRRMQLDAAEAYSPAAAAALAALTWHIVDVPLPGQAAGAAALVEAVLLTPVRAAGAPPPPVVLVPHGGPHAACVAGFTMPLAFLAACGYAVLQVNYRGSLGFGQGALESLIGRAGRQDVDDCLAALDAAAAAGLVDGARAAVVGGSHGGFLGAHLIGQSSRFACACLRNPVCDLSSMLGVSDISDWCYVETGGLGPDAYDEVPSPAVLAKMHAISPVAHIDAVRAPVLMLLGAKDRRVPPSNGTTYAHALRQRGVTVRMLTFPEDEHALSKPRTELESFANIMDWRVCWRALHCLPCLSVRLTFHSPCMSQHRLRTYVPL